MKYNLTRCILGLLLCSITCAFISGCSHQEIQSPRPHQVPAMMDSTLIYYLPSDDGQHLRRYEMKTAARDNTPVEALREMVRADKRLDSPLLPDGLSVNYVVVEHGTAFADFSSELSQLDTSPSVQELFIRITTDTLMEFADIQSVVIQINGNSMSFAHEVQNRRDNTPTMDSAS